MRIICLLLRPFLKDKSTICFVAMPDRPWGCNLEAYFMHAQTLPNIRRIYILNLSITASEEVAEETSEFSVPVEVITFREKMKLLQCVIRSELFFFGNYANHGIPGKKINLWHGIPLKKIGVMENKKWKKLKRRFSNVISAASRLDQNNMSLTFNMESRRVIPSGLPRHDWINGRLKTPKRFDQQLKELSDLLGDSKLLLYAPTFRDSNRHALPISDDRLEKMALFLKQYGYTLGLRAHVISNFKTNFKELGILDLSGDKFSHIEAIYRFTDILVTDYSSVCMDFMLTNKLIIGLDISNEPYERGFINDFGLSFPGHFYYDFDLFLNDLTKIFTLPDNEHFKFDYSFQKRLFLGNYESNACSTLTEHIFD